MRTKLATTVVLLAVLATSGCSFTIIEPGHSGEDLQHRERAEVEESGEVSNPLGIRTCAGESVTLDQDDTELILEGECGVLTITASRVSVTMESLAGLVVDGNVVGIVGGDVTGATSIGGSEVIVTAGDLATVDVSGDGNTIIAEQVTGLSVSGSNNRVNWSSGASTGDDTGQGNRLISP